MHGSVQASYLWQEEGARSLTEDCGFERSPVEPCTFFKWYDTPLVYPSEIEEQFQEILNIITNRHKINIQPRLVKHLGIAH
jgi:hypothetical protein